MPTLSLDDATIWYEETGEGPPLVFVHGGWSTADAWSPQVDYFARNHRVIRYDVRGHGRTGATERRRYSIDLFADDLERLLDHLDVDRPFLCGLSLGSMIVQTFLHRHPGRAAGASMVGAVQSIPPIDFPTRLKPYTSPVPAVGLSLSATGTEAVFRSLLCSIRATTGGPWLSVDPSIRSRAIDTAGDVPSAEFLKIFGALYRCNLPELSAVSAPVSVVYGEREAPSVKRQCEQIVASVANATSTELPGAAHLVNQDAPDAFNDTVDTLLH